MTDTTTATTELVTVTANASVIANALTPEQEMEAYIAELDKRALPQASGPQFTELRVISTDSMSEDLIQAKGTFALLSVDENNKRVSTPVGPIAEGVIIKVTNQYTIFDKAENKVTYSTNEFERGVEDRIICKNAEGQAIFKGNQAQFKDFAIKNFPDDKANNTPGNKYPRHLFKFRFVYYVLMPKDIPTLGPVGAVKRLYMGVSSMDNIKIYEKSLQGTPLRYLTQITTEKKDNGGVRFYPVILEATQQLPMPQVMEYAKIKKELDEALQQHVSNAIESATIIELRSPSQPPTVAEIQAAKEKMALDALAEAHAIDAEAAAIFG